MFYGPSDNKTDVLWSFRYGPSDNGPSPYLKDHKTSI